MTNSRFKCNRMEGCKRCGECCKFREKLDLCKEEERQIKEGLFARTGLVFPFPFDRYTISIFDEEKKRLLKLAKEKGINIKIIPKKIYVNEKNQLEIIDWFIDHDVCPFMVESNDEAYCMIYESRPKVCKIFPKKMNEAEINPRLNKLKNKTSLSYNEAVDLANILLEAYKRKYIE